jgi:nitroreductase
MEMTKAVLGRRSIRAFRPEPVPSPVLRELIDLARWTPSAVNSQPWDFTIVTGAPLQTLRTRLRHAAAADPVGKPEFTWSANLPERFKQRRTELGKSVLQALGVAEDDRAKKDEWFLFGIGFFDAPQVIVLSIDRALSRLALLDAGAVGLALQLLAYDRGLGSCPQAAPLRYPWIFHEVLDIPDSSQVLLALPIGYPAGDAAVNNFPRTRVATDALVRWLGTPA